MTAKIINFPKREERYTFSLDVADVSYDTGEFHALIYRDNERKKTNLYKKIFDNIMGKE
jgi:hypothetical protein